MYMYTVPIREAPFYTSVLVVRPEQHVIYRLMAGREPKLTWKKRTGKDCCELKFKAVDPQERSTWRSGARSAMCAACLLPGRGPSDVDDAPAP